jgi:uncharacterized delta-60 repeat protein
MIKILIKTFFLLVVVPLTSGCYFNMITSEHGNVTSETSSDDDSTTVVPGKVEIDNAVQGSISKQVNDLLITANDNISEIYITNTADCASGGTWDTVAPVYKNWVFNLPETSGKVYLYAKFKTNAGEELPCQKYEYDFVNDLFVTVASPADNEQVQGFHVFHGTCKPGTTVSVESADLTNFPTPVSCDGEFHIGVSLDGGTQGVKNVRIVSTDSNGVRKSSVKPVNFQNNGINSGLGFNGQTIDVKYVSSIDKLYVLGDFSTYNGAAALNIVRLNMNGTIDNTFTSLGFGASPFPYSMAIDPATNKIYVAGSFTSYGGGGIASLVRLNTDGTRDTSFTPVAFNDDVLAVEVDPVTSKVYVGGWFTNYAGSGGHRIARLNTNGSRDATFNVGSGFGSDVNRIQYDTKLNKLYVSGYLDTYGGVSIPPMVRLNLDGTRDTTFSPALALANSSNGAITMQSTSSAWTFGSWFRYISDVTINIATFNLTTGAAITPWTYLNNIDGEVLDAATDTAESYVVAVGGFNGIGSYNGLLYPSKDILKVTPLGVPFPRFKTGLGTLNSMGWQGRTAIDPVRGIIFIAGEIQKYNHTTRNNFLAISLDDGSLK